ncbi:MAG: hypothetical protein KKD63_03165 [Proteobacteria bacterium]|nr:hypothetical protein [Desulfobulbaceae bacterium]MBU4151859.1 hypothetical protein [Pseudomonadota bacterium]
MQITKSRWTRSLITGTIALGLLSAASTASADSYAGTAFVAGMGGHFAKAEFTIDPKAETPISISQLDMVNIGSGASHPTHDARIDSKDRDTMYWSTYKPDPAADNSYHYGKTDLKTGEVASDVVFKIPGSVINTKAGFCASAQTQDYFMPISMNKPGYISVIRKSDMKLMHTVFLEGTEADIKKGYKYFHGVNSPDMKEVLITINESDVDQGNKELGDVVGKMHMFVLDAAELEQGKVKVLRKGVADGNAKKSISFRQYYSPDGKYIANATGDILFLIDAATLKVLDAEPMPKFEETHDAIFTPDSKYVIATSRTKAILPDCKTPDAPADGEWRMDGQLKLYDVTAQKFIGKASSACLSCHDKEIGTDAGAPHAVLCGLDVNFKK